MKNNGIIRLSALFACFCLIIGFAFLNTNKAWADDIDVKAEAYALYNTNNINEALKLLENLPLEQKDEEVFVLIANIYEDKKEINKAIENLNKALLINPEYYKAYYNLGCIFLDKKAYELAEQNLLLSIKYNKDFAYSYYNLGTLYLKTGDYKKAKKNFLKAIFLKNNEKYFYLNLAYTYKNLGKEKEAKKLIEIYNNGN